MLNIISALIFYFIRIMQSAFIRVLRFGTIIGKLFALSLQFSNIFFL